MKFFGVLILVIFSTCALQSQEHEIVKWKFETGGKVLANPVIDDNYIYFGSMDSVFYALDINSGKKIWEYKSQNAIHSMPLVYGEFVYFKSRSNVFALDKQSGELIWSFLQENDTLPEQLDNWDYHSGSPAVFESDIYFGLNNGELIGFDLNNGRIKNRISDFDNAPVKSGLLVSDSLLFWGNWNGKVYCYNLVDNSFNWEFFTYNKQQYPTFGQIISQLSISDSLLYFGSRNPEFQVININTGKKQWNYIEEHGGWISGDPLVLNDTVYVGGSDNHEMFAFNSTTGEKLWTYEFLNNNFSRPAAWKNYLLFTTGDAYNVWGVKPGTGYLYLLNRTDGTIRNFCQFNGNIYSGLVIKDDKAYFGSSDGNFYCVDLLKFADDTTELSKKGYHAFDIVSIEPTPFTDSININLTINHPTELQIQVLDLEENFVCQVFAGKAETGPGLLFWNGKDRNGDVVNDGYFFIVITASDFERKTIIQKKNP